MYAWPKAPAPSAQLLKPHGTLTGDLILSSEQVLRGLDPLWESRLRGDVRGRVVVFGGYRDRDLDFQPIWDDVLRPATRVLWFDMPATPDDGERRHKQELLHAVLASGRLVPPIGPLRPVRVAARRKRVTILANRGRHAAVLRATRRIRPDDVSTLSILRSASVRMTGSLDEAATIASTRWVGWANYVEAALAVHRRDLGGARRAVDAGAARFRAEGLLDGEISVETVRLAVLRLAEDDAGFAEHRRRIEGLIAPACRGRGRLYARGHRFTLEAFALEDAEFARLHRSDLAGAERAHRLVAASTHPLHAALGHLGPALLQVQRGKDPRHAATGRAGVRGSAERRG